MASGLTIPAAEELGNFLLQAASAPTYPASFYVALMTYGNTTQGTGGTEVSTSGTGYGRVAIARSAAALPKTDAAQWQNANAVTFNNATSIYTVAQVCLYDAAAGGNCKAICDLPFPLTFNAGNAVSFPSNSLTFRLVTS
jgi:hypothetical protein